MDNKTADFLEIIKQSGISVTEIAEGTGIPRNRMYQWISGRSTPKYEDAAAVRAFIEKNKLPNAEISSGEVSVRNAVLVKLQEQGLKVSDIARLTDIPADRIYKWYAGKGTPRYEDVKKLQTLLPNSSNSLDMVNEPAAEYSLNQGWTLKQMVGIIQAIKDWTIEQVADTIDYSRVHLANAMATNDEAMRGKLLKVHGHLISNIPVPKKEAAQSELLDSFRDQIVLLKSHVQDLRDQISRLEHQQDVNLSSIEQNQLVLLAYQKAAHNLRVEFAAGSDKRKLTLLRAHADKALAESYVAKTEKGTRVHK
jgi:predicted transcriptional regulator